jgi:hypothetical protein
MTYQWPDATYACLNVNDTRVPDQIQAKSICINEDIGEVLANLL